MALKIGIAPAEITERLRSEAFLKLKVLKQQLSPCKGEALRIFVAGVHRSGTNMLMDILDASFETSVFHENDSRAFDNYIMREPRVIRSLIEHSRASVVVVKALHEAHRMRALLEDFAPAKGLWMIRYFADSVNSNLKRFPGNRNDLDAIVNDRRAGDWRGLGMADETYRIVKQHYRREMNDASANALFWYYRNQLFFDQGFDSDPRVLAIEYEELVRAPEPVIDVIAPFIGICASERMKRVSHSESVRKNLPPDIAPDVKALCEAMQQRLLLVARRQMAPGQASANARIAGSLTDNLISP